MHSRVGKPGIPGVLPKALADYQKDQKLKKIHRKVGAMKAALTKKRNAAKKPAAKRKTKSRK
jgi:hypothetical protein